MTRIAEAALGALWLDALQQVVGRAAHEVKGAINGVSLSLEVIRSRTAAGKQDGVADFAVAASDHLELVTARAEALLFLTREQRPKDAPSDAGITLRHLAALLTPAAKSDGGKLTVTGQEVSAPTSAPALSTRLALASGLLALIKEGGSGACRLDAGPEPVVRFSHESAGTCTMDPAIVRILADHGIRADSSNGELRLVFPRSQ